MGLRFNPPPGWPPAPPGFTPQPGWQPDPAWPPPPPGWQLWVPGESADDPATDPLLGQLTSPDQAGRQPWPDPQPVTDGRQPWSAPGPVTDGTQPWALPPGGPAQQPGATQPGASSGQLSWGAAPPPAGQQDAGGPPGFLSAQQPWGAPPAGPAGQPAWAAPYGAAPYGYGRPPGQQPLSWQAVVAFVTGLVGLSVLGVIFGILALTRIRSTGQRGQGLAIAGLALSGLWIIVVGLAIIGLATGPSTRGSASSSSAVSGSSRAAQPHGAGSTSVFALLPGDCFDNPTDQQSIASVASLPCTRPHDAQVFANFKLTGGDLNYPGTATVQSRAAAGCNARFGPAVDRSRITSSMTIRFIYPQQLAWTIGHRTVSCLIVDSGRDLRSSVLRSAGG